MCTFISCAIWKLQWNSVGSPDDEGCEEDLSWHNAYDWKYILEGICVIPVWLA